MKLFQNQLSLVACDTLALSRHDVKDVCGMTPPMVAAKFNNVDCLDCIVEAVGTDRFNWLYQDKWENTILSTACNYVSEDFAVYCVNCVEKDHKCLTMVNKNGDGALHLAAKNGMSGVVRLQEILEKSCFFRRKKKGHVEGLFL